MGAAVLGYGARMLTRRALVAKEDIFSLAAPIGIYNLGNSCFISAVLQCLVHCTPVKKYFLHDMGHHHLSCPGYRSVKSKGSPKKAPPTSTIDAPLHKTKEVCLACELDKIILRCFGSAAGTHVLSLVGERHESPADANPRLSAALDRGEPLVVNDMLVAVWNCKELSHLHGYAQRDAHEFLHGFLEILGKHTRRYRERVHQSLNLPRPSNAIVSDFPAVDQGEYAGGALRTKRRFVLMVICRYHQAPFRGSATFRLGVRQVW